MVKIERGREWFVGLSILLVYDYDIMYTQPTASGISAACREFCKQFAHKHTVKKVLEYFAVLYVTDDAIAKLCVT